MKLKALVDAVTAELETAGLSKAGVSLSLAFTAKRSPNGTVECDFIDGSSLSKPKPEEIHRLEVSLEENRKGSRLNVRMDPSDEAAEESKFLSGDKLDSPAIFRTLQRESDS